MKRWPNISIRDLWCIVVVVSTRHAQLSRPSTAPIVPGRPEDFGR